MKLNELKYSEGSKPTLKRVGRGIGSRRGKTSGRGQKGQMARNSSVRLGFEGGQTPIQRRLPKKGFSNYNHEEKYATINVEKLNSLRAGSRVTLEVLKEKGLIKTKYNTLKILGRGPLEKKLTVVANKFSKGAIEAIEKVDGKIEVL